ncbi:MAG: hypothetical protein ACREIV_05810, partial [Planctomycetaceae bacterium]
MKLFGQSILSAFTKRLNLSRGSARKRKARTSVPAAAEVLEDRQLLTFGIAHGGVTIGGVFGGSPIATTGLPIGTTTTAYYADSIELDRETGVITVQGGI